MKEYICLWFIFASLFLFACTPEQTNEDQQTNGEKDFQSDSTVEKTTSLIVANPLDLSQINRISKFRSCVGHDYSGTNSQGEKETLRSMKHYVEPLPSLIGIAKSIKVFAPFDGEIVGLENSPPGQQLSISADMDSSWRFIFFHVDPFPELKEGTEVKAGKLLGYASPQIMANFDIGLKQFRWRQTFDSPFLQMSEAVLAEYAAKGITLNSMIISKQARDADPCPISETRNGEAFFASSRNVDFVQLQSEQ